MSITEYLESNFKGLSVELIAQYIALLANLDESLTTILLSELSAGNKIKHVNKGWPSKNGIMVQMAGKMDLNMALPKTVQYKHINDPHYWMHQFTTYNGSNQKNHDLLICGDNEIPK